MRGAGGATPAVPGRRPNYFFFPAGFSAFFVGGSGGSRGFFARFGAGFGAGFLGTLGRSLLGAFFRALGRGFLRAFGRSFLFAVFFLFFDHLHVARRNRFGFRGRHFFGFGARYGHGDDRDALVAEDFATFRRLDFADMDGLAKFEARHINDDLFRQILGQPANFDFEQNMFEHAFAGLDANGFADRFDGHHDRNLFVLGDLMKIHMHEFAAQRVVLDFLQQRQPLRTGIVLHREIDQEVFRRRMLDQVANFLGADLQVLRLGLPAINDGGDAPGGAQFLCPAAPCLRTGKRVQCYRFHLKKLFRHPAAPA